MSNIKRVSVTIVLAAIKCTHWVCWAKFVLRSSRLSKLELFRVEGHIGGRSMFSSNEAVVCCQNSSGFSQKAQKLGYTDLPKWLYRVFYFWQQFFLLSKLAQLFRNPIGHVAISSNLIGYIGLLYQVFNN